MLTKKDKPRIALVIGSDSVKCAAAIGLKKVLERENIDLDMVVGCSGGAIYAALIALGWSVQRATESTLKMWTNEVTSKRNLRGILQLALPKIFKFDETFGLIDDSLINRRFHEGFAGATFAQTQIPLFVTATDFYTGEQAILSEGTIEDAVRASISIPYISPPKKNRRKIPDRWLSKRPIADWRCDQRGR